MYQNSEYIHINSKKSTSSIYLLITLWHYYEISNTVEFFHIPKLLSRVLNLLCIALLAGFIHPYF